MECLGWKSERMRSTESVRLLRKIFSFLQQLDAKVCQVPYLSYVPQPPLLPQLWLAIASPKSAPVTNFTLFLCTYPIQLTQYLCPLLTAWTPLMQINTQHRCGWKPALNRRWKMWNGCQISTVRVGQTVLLVYDLIPAYLQSYGWVVIKRSCTPDVSAAKVYWVRSHRHTGATWRSG